MSRTGILKHRLVLVFFLTVGLLVKGLGQSPFTFVQICDPQLGMVEYTQDMASFRQAVGQINDLSCDFVVICGDLVHHASDSSFADFQNIAGEFEIPVHLVAGNHDVGNIPTDSSLAIYRKTFGKDYYAFSYRDAYFVLINTQLYKTDLGEESRKQDQWLKGELASHQENDGPLFVLGHHPLFVKQANEEEVYANLPPAIRMELLDLFAQSGVVAYLSGHKHELLVNEYKSVQLVTGESIVKNFDGRPFGFRKWEVSRDSITHRFIPLILSKATDEESFRD